MIRPDCQVSSLHEDKNGQLMLYRNCLSSDFIIQLYNSITALNRRNDPTNINARNPDYYISYVADSNIPINYGNSIITADKWSEPLNGLRGLISQSTQSVPNVLRVYFLPQRINYVPGINFADIQENSSIAIMLIGRQDRNIQFIPNKYVRSKLKGQTITLQNGDLLFGILNFANNYALNIDRMPTSNQDEYAFILVFEERVIAPTNVDVIFSQQTSSALANVDATASSNLVGPTAANANLVDPNTASSSAAAATQLSRHVITSRNNNLLQLGGSGKIITSLMQPQTLTMVPQKLAQQSINLPADQFGNKYVQRSQALSSLAASYFRPTQTYALTEFEAVAIIGKRADMLDNNEGPPPLVDITGLSDSIEIATRELIACKLDFLIVRRPVSGVTIEKRVTDLQPGCQ